MYDFAIIGGGILGLSIAWQLQNRHPAKRIVLLEKEARLAAHQTGHNSGVIHAGIYYKPGSLKARFCKAGVDATIAFCRNHDIPYEQCGKLIVATHDDEQSRLLTLVERAKRNGLNVELLNADELRALEPNVAGTGAILLRTTGIVSYPKICEKMADHFRTAGGEIRLTTPVCALSENADRVEISSDNRSPLSARYLIVCGGLQADRLADMMGLNTDFRILPFRGEYYRLAAEKSLIVNHLIYPVPDPSLPFLGVHLTRMIDGSVTVGPNALQGWKREGYGGLNVSAADTWDQLTFPGFWRLSLTHFGAGLRELRNSLWKRAYLQQIQKYVPSITLADLEPYPAGIRAMAVKRDGTVVDDFLFAESRRSLHVCSAPSPAATSSIPIGEFVCELVEEKMSSLV